MPDAMTSAIDNQKIDAVLMQSYAKQALQVEVTGFLTGCAMALFFWRNDIAGALILWLLVLAAGPILHHILIRELKAKRWSQAWVYRLLLVFWLGSGCLWGAFSLICMQPDNTMNMALLTALAAGILVGALPNTSLIPNAYLLFAVPLASFYALAVIQTESEFRILAGLVWVLMPLMIFLSRQLHREMRQSIALRYRNEELVQRLQKSNADKSRFLAAASHDLRQPHQALGLFVESLLHLETEDRKKEILQKAKQAFQTMSDLLNQLLDISKLDSGLVTMRMQAVALQPLLHNIIMANMPKAEQYGLDLRLRSTDAVVEADPTMLSRVVSNLVSNAIRYTKKGGVLVAVRRRADKWQLVVCDTGEGIPDEDADRIFQEFVQLNHDTPKQEKGLGLGLSIVARLVKMMDMRLDMKSVVGKGTRFTLSMKPAHEQPKQHIAEEPSCLQGLHILVVDDDLGTQEALTILLKIWKCRVLSFADRHSCLRELPMFTDIPDAIIVDYHLNGRGQGMMLVNEIFAYYQRGMPVLMVTGDTSLRYEGDNKNIRLVHKPVDMEVFKTFLMPLCPKRKVENT